MDVNTPKKNTRSCSTCQWWTPENTVVGKCKRMPPSAHFEDGHYWPMTGRADWCGEYLSNGKTIAIDIIPPQK